MFYKKYVGDKAFYRMTLSVALPIMLQNLITNFVNMLDNLMVGAIGTEQMSAVSIVNQLVFVFNLAVFGAVSGAGIYTAQYYGKKDNEGIRYTLRYKLIVSAFIGIAAVAVFLLFGDKLISLYLHEGETTGGIKETFFYAGQYAEIIVAGLIPFAVTQALISTLRETGETFVPMVAGFSAVFINCALNFVLIFGKLGFPVLGVRGAAIATVISRYVELIINIVYMVIKRKRFEYISGLFSGFSVPVRLFKDISYKGLPLMLNEFLWSVAISLLSMSYSLHGIKIVAAVSIANTVGNLFNIAFMNLGAATGIIIGKMLGANELDEAYESSAKLIAFSVFVSLVVGFLMFSTSGFVTQLYNTDDVTKKYAAYFICCSALLSPAVSIANSSYFILRSGGRMLITILFDCVYEMCLTVPVAFSLYYIFKLSISVIYPIVISLDIIKAAFGIVLVRKKIWVKNLVG